MTAELYTDVQTGEEVWLITAPNGMLLERDRNMSWTLEEAQWLFEKVEGRTGKR